MNKLSRSFTLHLPPRRSVDGASPTSANATAFAMGVSAKSPLQGALDVGVAATVTAEPTTNGTSPASANGGAGERRPRSLVSSRASSDLGGAVEVEAQSLRAAIAERDALLSRARDDLLAAKQQLQRLAAVSSATPAAIPGPVTSPPAPTGRVNGRLTAVPVATEPSPPPARSGTSALAMTAPPRLLSEEEAVSLRAELQRAKADALAARVEAATAADATKAEVVRALWLSDGRRRPWRCVLRTSH
jgi:hypothetical protein